jgi:hypothetical protein
MLEQVLEAMFVQTSDLQMIRDWYLKEEYLVFGEEVAASNEYEASGRKKRRQARDSCNVCNLAQ